MTSSSSRDLSSNFNEIKSESIESKCDVNNEVDKTTTAEETTDQYCESGSNDEYSPHVSPSSSFCNDEKIKDNSSNAIISKQPKYERKLLRQMHCVGVSDITGYYSDDSAVRRNLYYNSVLSKKESTNEIDGKSTRDNNKDDRTKPRSPLFLKKTLTSTKSYKSEKVPFDVINMEKSLLQSFYRSASTPGSLSENEQDDNVIRRTYSFLKKKNMYSIENESNSKTRATRRSFKQRNSSLPISTNDVNIVVQQPTKKTSKKRNFSTPPGSDDGTNKSKSRVSRSLRLRRQRSSVCEAIISKTTPQCGSNKNTINVINNTEGTSSVSITSSSIRLYSGTAEETEKKHFEATIFDSNRGALTDYEDYRPEGTNSYTLKTRKKKQKRRVSTKDLTLPVHCLSSGDECPALSKSPKPYLSLMRSLSRSLTNMVVKDNSSHHSYQNESWQLNGNTESSSTEDCSQHINNGGLTSTIEINAKENSENLDSSFESNSEIKKSSSLGTDCRPSSTLFQVITSQHPDRQIQPDITEKPVCISDTAIAQNQEEPTQSSITGKPLSIDNTVKSQKPEEPTQPSITGKALSIDDTVRSQKPEKPIQPSITGKALSIDDTTAFQKPEKPSQPSTSLHNADITHASQNPDEPKQRSIPDKPLLINDTVSKTTRSQKPEEAVQLIGMPCDIIDTDHADVTLDGKVSGNNIDDSAKEVGTKGGGTKEEGTKEGVTKKEGTKEEGTKEEGTKRDGTTEESTLSEEVYMNGNIELEDECAGNTGDENKQKTDNNQEDKTMRYEKKKKNALKRFQLIDLKSKLTMDLKSYLSDKHFESDKVSAWCHELSESIKEKVVEVTDGEYKVVAQVFIGALVDRGIHLATETGDDGTKDGFFAVCYRGRDIFAVASILAFDLN